MSLIPQTIVALAREDIDNKNIIPGTPFSVEKRAGGVQAIYEDFAGTTLISQPAETDSNGELHFYIEPGEYTYTLNGEPYQVNVNKYSSGGSGGSGDVNKKIIKTITTDATYIMSGADSGKFIVIEDEGESDTSIYLPAADDPSVEVGMFWDVYLKTHPIHYLNNTGVIFDTPFQGSMAMSGNSVYRFVCIESNRYMAYGNFAEG